MQIVHHQIASYSSTCQELQPNRSEQITKPYLWHGRHISITSIRHLSGNHSTRVPGFVVVGAVMYRHASLSLAEVSYCWGILKGLFHKLFLCVQIKQRCQDQMWHYAMCSAFYNHFSLRHVNAAKIEPLQQDRKKPTDKLWYILSVTHHLDKARIIWSRRDSSCFCLLQLWIYFIASVTVGKMRQTYERKDLFTLTHYHITHRAYYFCGIQYFVENLFYVHTEHHALC